MPLFTILLALLLLQVLLTTSLFWDQKGGRILLLHLGVQTVCWSLLRHLDDAAQLFTFGMEQTVFWANILLGLVWVDWSLPSRWVKAVFAGSVLFSAACASLELLEWDYAAYGATVAQFSCQLLMAWLLAQTIKKQQDVSLSAFLGGWLGLIAIELGSQVNFHLLEEPYDISSHFIGAFIVGSAACFRLCWLMLAQRNDEMEKLREELQAATENLEKKDQQILEIADQLTVLEKEFKNVERDLQRSQSELYQQAKTTSLGHSSLQISYQLQGILVGSMNRLRRIVQGLEENGHRDSVVCQKLAVILKSLDHATLLTSTLQKFGGGRKEASETLLNVQTWLREVISLCDQRMKKSEIHLDIKDEAGDVWVKGRVADLMHALLILLNNSCDALEFSEVRRITIELRRMPQVGQDMLRLVISDSGQGVPTGIRARIFQPFFSTKSLGQGSGLGLTIASRIINEHGGAIQLDAEALATTFIVDLPLEMPASVGQELVT